MQVSIILPTYNRYQILNKTIENVLKQTYNNFELIIINDASVDCTIETVKQYLAIDSRIKLINNLNNQGCAKSRQIGCENAKYKYLVFIDDDDEWDKNKLQKQMQLIKESNADVVISDYFINDCGTKKYKDMKKFFINFKYQILKNPGPFFQSIVIKKDLYKLIENPFDSKSIPSEDWNFFIELSKVNPKFGYVNEALFTWNLHKNSQSSNISKEACALTHIVNKHFDYIRDVHGTKVVSNHYRRIARLYERLSDFDNVNKFYFKAYYMCPTYYKNIFYYICALAGYKYTRKFIQLIRFLRGVPNE
tara:strand:+ start:6782 stop:7699 length:918 start_codon:yes stop_codon:yes gene_type:complete